MSEAERLPPPSQPQTPSPAPPDGAQRPTSRRGARQGAAARTTQPPSLRGQALRLLARRDWSRQALRERLHTPANVTEGEDTATFEARLDALLEEFAERGWVSDARYAEAVVRQRKDRYGKAAIARRLKQAGVSESAVTDALAGMDADHEFATALALLRRRFRAPPADDKDKARQIRFLQARGYSLGLALRVLKHPVNGIEES